MRSRTTKEIPTTTINHKQAAVAIYKERKKWINKYDTVGCHLYELEICLGSQLFLENFKK